MGSTGVDTMMSMASRYFGKDVASNQQWATQEMEQHVTKSQLAVGIGTMTTNATSAKWDYQWDAAKLHNFMAWLQEHDIGNVDIWRADIDNLNGTAEEYYYDLIADFLQGTPVSTITTT